MFESSLVESTAILHTGNRWPAIISTAFYTAIALALVTIPVLHPDAINTVVHPLLSLVLPPPVIPPPPPMRVHVSASDSSAAAIPTAPTPILNTHGAIAQPMPVAVPNFNATSSMTNMGTTSILNLGTPSTPYVRATTATNGTGDGATYGHLSVSTGISKGLLLTPLEPVYPSIARAAHQEGTVMVHAIISRAGQIESARVVSGPAMLQASALNAVRSARYRPYLLNGQPTEVDTTFSITFHLSSYE